MLSRWTRIVSPAAVLCGVLGLAGSAAASPIKLLPIRAEFAKHRQQYEQARSSGAIVPPPSPCPQNGLLPQSLYETGVIPNCGIPELPLAFGEPYPGQMSYYGGHVQTHPREYLVLWGWGEHRAFGSRRCHTERIREGSISTTLPCDPDGAGRYMADFLRAIGGTQWANVQDQYYQTGVGRTRYVNERGNLLAGIWVDDRNPGNLQKTSASKPPGRANTYTRMALEATRAARHFHVGAAGLKNANFIIAQPQRFSDPQAATTSSVSGYCAFHDYTLYGATGNADYNPRLGVRQDISYTNMPYALNAGVGCGEGAVNRPGKLDGFSIGLGHEVQETVTDPGAEDVIGNITNGGTRYYGGWYDQLDGNENGDKCAYVGSSPTAGVGGTPNLLPIPGAMGDIRGRHGRGSFAVQSLWSDAAAGGTGWCAGIARTDLPGRLSGEPPY